VKYFGIFVTILGFLSFFFFKTPIFPISELPFVQKTNIGIPQVSSVKNTSQSDSTNNADIFSSKPVDKNSEDKAAADTNKLNDVAINGPDFLNIEINGELKKYTPKKEMTNNLNYNVWYVSFVSLMHNENTFNDSFFFTLPNGVKTGDNFVIDSKIRPTDFFNLRYINSRGISYTFGYPPGYDDGTGTGSRLGQHYSSKATIVIDHWVGMSGYAVGTINGEIWLTPNVVVNFSNGKFKVKLNPSNF